MPVCDGVRPTPFLYTPEKPGAPAPVRGNQYCGVSALGCRSGSLSAAPAAPLLPLRGGKRPLQFPARRVPLVCQGCSALLPIPPSFGCFGSGPKRFSPISPGQASQTISRINASATDIIAIVYPTAENEVAQIKI